MDPTGHPILGLIVIGLLAFMPAFGWIHHVVYVKKRGPSAWTYIHRWLGRIILIAGGINGGLGIWMAHDKPQWLLLAYTACAAFFYGTWLSTAVLLEMLRKRKVKAEKVREEEQVEKAGKMDDERTGRPTIIRSGEESDRSSRSDRTMVDEERHLKINL